MDENKFWLGFWSIVASVLCTMIVSIGLVNYSDNTKRTANLTRLVESGTPPLYARCAVYGCSDAVALTLSRDSK